MSTGHPVTAPAPLTTGDPDQLEPDIARVSILGGHTQLDVGLPAQIPIASLLPTVIAQVRSRSPQPARPTASDGDIDDVEVLGALPDPQCWTLAPVGRDPLPTNLSLHDAGIRDGALLALRPIRVGDTPVLFDDVIDALAELGTQRFSHWSPATARYVGYAVALVAALVGAIVLVVGHFAPDPSGRLWWPAPIAALVSVGMVVAAVLTQRYRHDDHTAAVLTWTALLYAGAGGAALTPGAPSSTTVVLCAASVVVVAVVSHRALGCSPTVHAAVTTVALIVGPAALCQVFVGTPQQVAAAVGALGIVVVFAAPRLTSMLAKLPLPSVPTAGEPIDAAEVVPTAIDGIGGAVGSVTMPKAESLSARAVVAQSYLTGISVGSAIVAAGGAVLAAAPWTGFDTRTYGYACVIAAVVVLRGRSHTDLVQASALIIVGAGGLLALLGGLLTSGLASAPTATLSLFGCAAAMFGGAVVFGVVAPTHDFSPVARRCAELAEYLLVVSIVPLLLWILDLYQVMRSLR